MGVAPVLQIRRMVMNQSSRDVSLAFLVVYLVGWVLWLAYGVSLGNTALVVANVVSLVFGAAALAVALRLRPRRRFA